VKVLRWILAESCVLRVEADALVFPDCPEPSFTPQTVRWLEHLQSLADNNQVEELAKHGTVYVRRPTHEEAA
jgi:hypothetical protein